MAFISIEGFKQDRIESQLAKIGSYICAALGADVKAADLLVEEEQEHFASPNEAAAIARGAFGGNGNR